MNRPFFTCFYCYFSLYAQYGTGPAMASMPEYGSVPSVPSPMPSRMILTHFREQFNECWWTGHFLHVSTVISVHTNNMVLDRQWHPCLNKPSVPGPMTSGIISTHLHGQFNECSWMGHFLYVSTVILVRTQNMALERQCHPWLNMAVYHLFQVLWSLAWFQHICVSSLINVGE